MTAQGSEARPLVLVTNDDGVHAPGIAALAEAATALGEVVVIAPDRNQSGVSHAISLHRPLRALEVRRGWWSVDGTPADCVYLGAHQLLPRRPSLVLSGVNAGPNMSFDVHYSGTVGGAMEGTLLGVPGIAVSLTDRDESYAWSARFAVELARQCLAGAMPSNVALNVNVPGGTASGVAAHLPRPSPVPPRRTSPGRSPGGRLLLDRRGAGGPSRSAGERL